MGTDFHRTISKNSSGCRLLIGHKKCFVLLCPIGEHISWVLFVFSYTTAIVSITACLSHVPKKCTQSGNFQFWYKIPIWFQNTVWPKTKDAFPKIRASAYNRYSFTCASATSCVNIYREFLKDTTTAYCHENVAWKSDFILFSVSIVIIPARLLCQIIQANYSGAEFLQPYPRSWREWILSLLQFTSFTKREIRHVHGLRRTVDGKEMYKKAWCSCKVVVLPCQAIAYLTFLSPPHLKLPIMSYYLRYTVIRQKQNIRAKFNCSCW